MRSGVPKTAPVKRSNWVVPEKPWAARVKPRRSRSSKDVGLARTGRYQDARGRNVLMDVDVLQAVAGADDGFGTPRLDPPMRLVRDSAKLGGKVGALFPMMNPAGQHSLPVPNPDKPFDLGTLVIALVADSLGSGGTHVSLEPCMERSSCAWLTKTSP